VSPCKRSCGNTDQSGVAITARLQKRFYLANRSVCFQEIRLQECIEKVAGDALDGVINGQDMDSLSILDIGTLKYQNILL
jgi:hypothetical protein